jgi:glycosyltransferase involved in cell wall biosynthesis
MVNSICFVGMDNYPVLNPTRGDLYFGGESVQQTLLAKAFRDLNYRASMVVLDQGQPQGETIDDIQIYKTYAADAGIPIVKFVHPRITATIAALRLANAQTYFQSCAGMMTGIVAWYCRTHNRKFIFRLAHDTDCIRGAQLINLWRDKKIYEYGLYRADLISAQGIKQVSLLTEHYNLHSIPINMTVEFPSSAQPDKDIDVLWVNNLRDFKHPELVPVLANSLPDVKFTMIGGPVAGHEELYEKVKLAAASCANLDFLGPVPYEQVNDYFSRSRVFANTSDTEGFPNSFLQAWARGVPVISFFDPDGLISKRNLGAVPDNLEMMSREIEKLLSAERLLEEFSNRVKRFALENYSPEAVAKIYEAHIASPTNS